MLFNSFGFMFVFLPACLLGYFAFGSMGRAIGSTLAAAWLTAMSLGFYYVGAHEFLLLLLGSMAFNFSLGLALSRLASHRKSVLILGLAVNLCVLAYFKYYGFFASEILRLTGSSSPAIHIALPIGISFFTFTQIAFLVDVYQRKAAEFNFIRYALFVTFFPHLIAGPILHHHEMMSQFRERAIYKLRAENISVGLTIFVIGLFKKIVLADGIAPLVGPVFDAPATPDMASAWIAALAYSLQLYFDFSGYSDMAIGLSRMFGIILPLNFDSPYKATSIIAFWRRWHMSLSRFLRDYLYIPLGGSRRGEARRLTNLLVTMILGGIWHGAGWTFLLWGTAHGVLLVANHLLNLVFPSRAPASAPMRAISILATFLLVTMAWVLFRAPDLPAAQRILSAMLGFHGWGGEIPAQAGLWIAALLGIVWFLPNTQTIMRLHQPVLPPQPLPASRLAWQPGLGSALVTASMAVASILLLQRQSAFLYFQF